MVAIRSRAMGAGKFNGEMASGMLAISAHGIADSQQGFN